jgi:hypothetical protein
MRIATILCHLPHRKKGAKPPPIPKVALETAMFNSSHVCVENEHTVSCARCRSNFSKSNVTLLRSWLGSVCSAIGSSSDAPTALLYHNIHIGKTIVHHSHSLMMYKGLLYCNRCGCMSKQGKLHGLALACGPPKPYGRSNLGRIKRGLLPFRLECWPCETAEYLSDFAVSEPELEIIANIQRTIEIMRGTGDESPASGSSEPDHVEPYCTAGSTGAGLDDPECTVTEVSDSD